MEAPSRGAGKARRRGTHHRSDSGHRRPGLLRRVHNGPCVCNGKDGGLANVEVYLKDITKGKAPSTDPATISLVNTHCMFSPRSRPDGLVSK